MVISNKNHNLVLNSNALVKLFLKVIITISFIFYEIKMIRIKFKVLNLMIFGLIQIHFRFHHKIVVNSFRGMTIRSEINFLKIIHNMEIILIFIFKISEFKSTQKLSTNIRRRLAIINIFRVVSSTLMIVLNLNNKNHLKHYLTILLFHLHLHLHPVNLLIL